MRLTDMTIKTLASPERNQRTYFDDTLPGFGCRVSTNGVRSFVVVTGRSRRITTIGRYPTITLAEARKLARELLAEHVLGKSRAPSHVPFGEAVETFLKGADVRESTRTGYRRILQHYLLPRFKLDMVERVSTHDLTRIIDKVAVRTPSAAHHLYVAAATLMPLNAVTMTGALGRRNSSPVLVRGFCTVCGTSLFTERASAGVIGLTCGSLDMPEDFQPTEHIWTSSKQAWLTLNDGLPQYPEGAPA